MPSVSSPSAASRSLTRWDSSARTWISAGSELAARAANYTALRSFSMEPGFVDTPMTRQLSPATRKRWCSFQPHCPLTAEEGASTLAFMVLAPDAALPAADDGAYFAKCEKATPPSWDAASQTYVDVTGAPSSFPNMFRCLWLAIVTMTSVGYGGISPVTFVGKLTCVLAAVCGSFYIAVPLTVIGNKFYDSYKMYRQVCDTSRQQRTLASSAALPSAGLY